MAIDPIKKLTILSPRNSSKRLMRTVSALGIIDVIDAGEQLEDKALHMRIKSTSTEDVDDVLRKIEAVLSLLKAYAPEEQGFFQGLTPVPQIIDREELRNATENYDLEGRSRQASELDEILKRSERAKTDIENRLAALMPFVDLPFTMEDFHRPRKTCLLFGYLPRKHLEHLGRPVSPWQDIAWEIIDGEASGGAGSFPAPKDPKVAQTIKENARVLVAVLKDDADDVKNALSRLSFVEINLPDFSETIGDHAKGLQEDLAQLSATMAETIAKVETLAPEHRTLITLKAFWTANRNECLALTKTVGGKWVHLLTGYIRTRDVDRFQTTFATEFPESAIVLEDPAPDEDVPVSLALPKAMRPLSLLVEMFGLPPYRSFDPTPYLHVNFYLFFGICFSDVGYGLMLIATSLYLIKRTKQYQGVADFGRILLMGGISTVIFGALLGSWFGDLYQPKYLGENNPLLRLQSIFAILDPVSKTIHALLIALFIGVLNQFFGIGLRMYGALREGDWKSALFDGFFWYLTLPGLLILVSKLFVNTPQPLYQTGIALFGAGALGLILTQGRDQKNPVARILSGMVSLYGIVGSYGITAFIGDTLSYCRLLALGLTTSIVGTTFNMLGGLMKDIPYVGLLLFVLIVVAGHLFNFVISLLGAFVHSMRLIFVEFFGRFYDAGGRPFRPLGFDSPLCEMKKEGTRNG